MRATMEAALTTLPAWVTTVVMISIVSAMNMMVVFGMVMERKVMVWMTLIIPVTNVPCPARTASSRAECAVGHMRPTTRFICCSLLGLRFTKHGSGLSFSDLRTHPI